MADKYSKSDPELDAKLMKEAREEEKAIKRTCEHLDLQIHEARVYPLTGIRALAD